MDNYRIVLYLAVVCSVYSLNFPIDISFRCKWCGGYMAPTDYCYRCGNRGHPGWHKITHISVGYIYG